MTPPLLLCSPLREKRDYALQPPAPVPPRAVSPTQLLRWIAALTLTFAFTLVVRAQYEIKTG
eukprot:gene43024-58271_t